MKFICTKENLIRALNVVSPLAGKQSNLPILDNILIQAKGSLIELYSTNLESAIKTSSRARVEKEGSFTVPAKTLTEYVHLLNEEQVEVTVDGNELLIVCGSSSTKIKGTSSDEYPVIPELGEHQIFSFDLASFKNALARVVIAVAKNEIRPELSGLYFGFGMEHYPEGLVLAATDSYRLAESKIPFKKRENGDISSIVPARVVQEIIRLLSLAEREASPGEDPQLLISKNQIALHFFGTQLIARLVEGTYPDYVQIIPKNFKTRAVVPVDIMINKIKAASLFSASGINAVSFDLNVSNKTMGISSMSSQTGEHSSEIESELEGEENSILLNFRYVLDGLQHMPGETIFFGVNSGESPCVLRPSKEDGYTYVVMPIRK
ncbi:MAG: DNA polymerase III subunit beta [Candidatus Magasanikbacteria bacterium]|nr:DNA polymerase III subunit beta [Candidatus Magasanikbacteria bacterium]